MIVGLVPLGSMFKENIIINSVLRIVRILGHGLINLNLQCVK